MKMLLYREAFIDRRPNNNRKDAHRFREILIKKFRLLS